MPSTPFPPQNYNFPPPGYAAQPPLNNWSAPPAAAPQPAMPVMAALAKGPAKSSAAPRPTIRMQAPDTLLPKPASSAAPLLLPNPEALGIHAGKSLVSTTDTLDWNSAHARLQRLGALGFHMIHLPNGSIRVTFLLPEAVDRSHEIEVVAGSETAAVNAALANAESWAVAKR
jgi:hypothetical protein